MSHAAFSSNLHGLWESEVLKSKMLAKQVDVPAVPAVPAKTKDDESEGVFSWMMELVTGNQEQASQQTVMRLKTLATQIKATQGEFAQIHFSIQTSNSYFQLQSHYGEQVDDLIARVARTSLLPEHGGLETASVRTVSDSEYIGFASCGCSPTMSRSSSTSTFAGSSIIRATTINVDSDDDEDDVESDSEMHMFAFSDSVRRPSIRFSDAAEQIYYSAETPIKVQTLQSKAAQDLSVYSSQVFF